MSTTLPLFWHLSAASKKERIDASVKLVSALELFQSQFTPAAELVSRSTKSDDENYDDEGDEASRKGEDLDLLNAQDVSYSIRRLVRGLSSPRESSRLGFAVALTEVSCGLFGLKIVNSSLIVVYSCLAGLTPLQ